MFDFHIHTHNSLDSKQTLDEICTSAIKKHLSGVAVTDHVDMWFYERENTEERILNCIKEVNEARQKYGEKLDIMQGVEMAEYLFDSQNADTIMDLTDYDVILGSVHSVRYEDWTDSYSRLDFSTAETDKVKGFIREYFEKVYEMTQKTDFDILSHLTCPFRYINGKYGKNIDSMEFITEIEEILKLIIKRDISLEINTSGIGSAYNSLLPDRKIMEIYHNMGGRLVTLGSDAHTCENIANGFDFALDELKDAGFRELFIFKKRKPIAWNL